MNKLSKLFIALTRLIKQPSLLNLVIDNPEANKQEVISKYNLPTGFKEINFSDITKHEPLTLPLFSFGGGGSMPTDLLLLQSLAKNISNCNYFEIGTWRGESAYNVSRVVEKVFTLNLSNEELVTLNENQNYINQIALFSKDIKNIEHLKGNSFTFDFSKFNKTIDLVFVDGDHRYPAVVNDTKKAFDLLKSEKSIIVWHDYAASPNELRYEVMLGILDGAPKWAHKHIYKVSNCLCAIYYPFEIESKVFNYPGEVSKTYSVTLK